ncbi:DUF4055 domain-containing protein [Xylophilus sp.]|uniref:DUF4055 domain-containing protein n=1 Tax=Xylophilus sp. TaxID=2653893 RepID=UPI002D7EF235|nr:DUF4055 domain-containing protein [Xylophilus sp.]
MRCDWRYTEALMRGTRAMREGRELFMPRWPNEEEEAYEARIESATLLPAYRRTVSVMSGKPFSKQLTTAGTSDEVAKEWKPWLDDIDRNGVSLNVFAAEMMAEIVAHGLAGIYVDVPMAADVAASGTGTPTIADERAAGIRPYFVRVKHDQILGWRLDDKGGLAMLRFIECYEREDGPFGTVVTERVWVLTPGHWEHWEAADGKIWSIVASGDTSLSVIPFVPIYGEKVAPMVGRPPLLDLAFLNVKHWQSQSDQDTILHVARVPILAMIGADENTQLVVGVSAAVKLPTGAEMKFVEHTGAAITAGADSIKALEEQMIQTGAELLVQKPGHRTATEDSNDAEGNKCDLQRIVESFEDALDQAFVFAGLYAKMDPPRVTLFKDFGAATLTDASAQLIVTMQQGGLITKQTAIREQQRRGVLSPDIDPEVEAAEAAAEGPALGEIGQVGPGGPGGTEMP